MYIGLKGTGAHDVEVVASAALGDDVNAGLALHLVHDLDTLLEQLRGEALKEWVLFEGRCDLRRNFSGFGGERQLSIVS